MHNNPIADALSSVTLGPAVVADNLSIIPLVAIEWKHSLVEYVVVDDALASGDVEITEVSEQGSVPELRVVNRGGRPVLIIDGEELIGAKQNRVVNLTILVPAQAELTIPVSCVEAGRWRARSRSFTAAPRTHYASGRAKRMVQVTAAMACRGERVSDQSEVWNDISQKMHALDASSPTSAMDAIFRAHDATLEKFVERLPPAAGQVGAAFAIGGRVVGFDLFDKPATLRRFLPKLIRSVALDALDGELPSRASVQRVDGEMATLLKDLTNADMHAMPAVGLGRDCRLTGSGLAGAALVVENALVHLGAMKV